MTESDRRFLSFSQAEGLQPLPAPLALNVLSKEFRALLWNKLYNRSSWNPRADSGTHYRNWINLDWLIALRDWHVKADHKPVDEFDPQLTIQLQLLKIKVYDLRIAPLFDFLTFLMRHRKLSYLEPDMIEIFEESRVAYRIADKTIFPSATPEEGAVVSAAFVAIAGDVYAGARSHLRSAAEALNAGLWADAVRESIHSVESVSKVIEPRGQTLADALKKLNHSGNLNPNLSRGLEALYNYTSDEKGVRHAKVFSSETNVDRTDATFMFGACAAFISYLIARTGN